MDHQQKIISVIGSGQATPEESKLAEEVGRELAKQQAILVCGGLGGVMEAACRGAKAEGGLTIGILPGDNRETANPNVQIPIVTSIGYARNASVAKTGEAVIAIGGSYGTLSEIAFALQSGIPVIGLGTWSLYKNNKQDMSIIQVKTPSEAVREALRLAKT